MKIAIMQPYFMPYIGYFQLINAVDKFVIYDDVNFIKGGWINRNNILLNNKSFLFSIPINNQSSFTKINSVKIDSKLYYSWKNKFLKTIFLSYKKASNFEQTYQILELTLAVNSDEFTISNLSLKAINNVLSYLKIDTEIIESSSIFNNNELKSQDRVIDICKLLGGTKYINPIGGVKLYDKNVFESVNLNLKFLQSKNVIYNQFNKDFISNLSIIDVLMFNEINEINSLLGKYNLI